MPGPVSIEGGCVFNLDENEWEYRYEDTDGFHYVWFSSLVTPKIGDTIVDGVLVPLVGYKINNDPGFQMKR